MCWGSNARDQLGRGDACPGDCPIAGDVVGAASGVVSIAAGANHSCALFEHGGMTCWGNNDAGQLGDGTLTRRDAAVDVCADETCAAALGSVTAIAAAGDHTCALLEGGFVRCWGRNGHASLTDSRICSPNCMTPAEVCLEYAEAAAPPGCVEPLDGVGALAIGNDFQCALRDGRVLCWGDHDLGQLGSGNACGTAICTEPFEVCADAGCTASLDGVTAIAAGAAHACVLASGAMKCWGRNDDAELGDGVLPPGACRCRNTPVDVVGLPSTPKETPPATSTPTRTATAVVTATATAVQALCGDVNGSGGVDSVDAAIVLQYDAGLFQTFRELDNADTNGDGAVNSIDAALILQHTAGRLAALRCPAQP
jgi:alpha-tubulin suppressor-like RCC1 family protein